MYRKGHAGNSKQWPGEPFVKTHWRILLQEMIVELAVRYVISADLGFD